MAASAEPHQKAIIGNIDHDYWVYDNQTGFDFTRSLTSPKSTNRISLTTTKANITVDPTKSALIVIDMQNFFLSPQLGRPAESKGLIAQRKLLDFALPAARKAGIQVVWLNWGLSDEDIEVMPPATMRAFGFGTISAEEFEKRHVSKEEGGKVNETELAKGDLGKDGRLYKGLGQSLGSVRLADGSEVDAGRMLVKQQWNTELSPDLRKDYEASLNSNKPDIVIDKIRISGMHNVDTPAGKYLRDKGLKTLFFAGVNTDQCVNGTLADAYSQGFDCVLLEDGCATTSPGGAQECVSFNVANTMGFVMNCQNFARGVDKSINGS